MGNNSPSPQIAVVLVEPSHPGNIGAVARAMKNMGLSELRLVRPKRFPDPEATARAAGAEELLREARCFDALEEAIAPFELVVGTTARPRTISWPRLTPRELAERLKEAPEARRVALLFGRERSGLTNEELDLCHLWLTIPANPQYPSLNLAQAVQIVAYEIFLAQEGGRSWPLRRQSRLATLEESERFLDHLERVMAKVGFLHERKSPALRRRLRRLFRRAQLERVEIDILRGFLDRIEKRLEGEWDDPWTSPRQEAESRLREDRDDRNGSEDL